MILRLFCLHDPQTGSEQCRLPFYFTENTWDLIFSKGIVKLYMSSGCAFLNSLRIAMNEAAKWSFFKRANLSVVKTDFVMEGTHHCRTGFDFSY